MKKTKKKSVLKKKEKIAIVIAGILGFIIILGLASMPTKRVNKNNQIPTNNNDLNRELSSIKEIVEYLEATYISTEDSKTDGYDIDIYINFPYNLFEKDISKEIYFKNFYEKIARITNFKSFRLIDSNRTITIEVKCENGKIKEVKINGEIDYYKKEKSRRGKENELKIENIDIEINSQELQNLINNNWVTANVDLGNAESKYNKYDIYFDEGYEVRTIQGKLFNIVFTEKYKKSVVANYKPGDSLEKIETKLGNAYKGDGIIGYKTKDFYVVFSKNEISIYPNRRNDYEQFEKLLEEYNEKQDKNDFLDKLTDIWPDYDSYSYDNKYVEIYYTLKGVRISFASANQDGIQIYENYKGSLKNEKIDYKDTYYHLDKSLIMEKEEKRKLSKEVMTDDTNKEANPLIYSEKFSIEYEVSNGSYKNVKIQSVDGEYPHNELDDTIVIYKYVWADDTHLLYSIYQKGIYLYDATTRETQVLLEGSENYEIKDYNRQTRTLTYDGEKVIVNF